MDTYRIKITFTESLLGTVPLNKEIYREYIAGDRDPETLKQELSTLTVDEAMERGTTGFHRLEGSPAIYDYAIKGFFKDACGMMRRVADSESAKLQAFKKVIDGLVFVEPRLIPLEVAGEVGILERPLRAQTAQGERVSLARSQFCPAGTTMEFTVKVLAGVSEKLLREWLDYGALRGLGQWRNASWGRFECMMRRG